VRRRDQELVFEDWLSRHGAIPAKIARAHATARVDQDDMYQEILLQLWVSIPSFQGKCRASTWVYRVALNTAFAWLRGERKHAGKVALASIPELAADDDTDADADEMARLLKRLYAEIRKMPGVDRALMLMQLDGVSYRDMADILGISVNYVGVKLNRIKKQLTVAMEDCSDAI
jgi:RNA polymerase sigma-70 factor, ECF subfamily